MKTLQELHDFVAWAHRGQTWAGRPYVEHLDSVREVLTMHGLSEERYGILHEAALMHDLFEDTPITPDMAMVWGANPTAVLIADSVTDEEGESRHVRKERTYPKIRQCELAVILKLADRISNLFQTLREGRDDRHWRMYFSEHPGFVKALERKEHRVAKNFWKTYKRIIARMK